MEDIWKTVHQTTTKRLQHYVIEILSEEQLIAVLISYLITVMRKAFDGLNQDALWQVLRHYNECL